MSGPIRVLIVDDSVVVRRLVAEIVGAEDDLVVADTAANGRIALEKLEAARPDIVTLDVEMPEMDGLATLKALRERRRDLPVIMFSTLTSRGAATTIEALSSGASDYITKPEGVSGLREGMERIRAELLPRLRALGRVRHRGRPAHSAAPGAVPAPATRTTPLATPRPPLRPAPPRGPAAPVEAVVIGVSTGGPNALTQVLPALPAELGVPLLVVQHMPPVFTRMLAERLDERCALRVREAVDGARPRPGEIWIARGDWHMELRREQGLLTIREQQGAPVNSCRPAVDVLFSSAVRCCGGGLLAVVLTGMGRDGTRGAQEIHEAGGMVLAQDQASSVVWGMPGSVVEAGLADEVRPLEEMAQAIQSRLARWALRGVTHGAR
jgi:two-component system, chemotaxis family, protein-glutamate methylesterase/glutaminase